MRIQETTNKGHAADVDARAAVQERRTETWTMTTFSIRAQCTAIATAAIPSLLIASPATAAQNAISPGDTGWVMIATILVLLMALPGLAIFYGGLVRTKNVLSMLMQVFTVVCIVSIIWVIYGYSLTYTTSNLAGHIGGLSKLFLRGVTTDSSVATFSNGVHIPEYAFIAFQMTFACITPCLIAGAFAERMRFPATLLFLVLWVTFVYIPLAHMTWYWAGPDAIAEAARAVQRAPLGEARLKAEYALQATLADAGIFRQWGVLDFAGGFPVHISAGISGLVGAIILGKRAGYGRDSMAPHNLALTMTGAALLWVGWLGFNSGSALRANGTAALALLNTFVAAAAAGMSWLAAEWFSRGKPSPLGLASGILAGLVAVTPAAGYVGPLGGIVLGFASGGLCFWFSTSFKEKFQYDDSLDVFGVHCIAGILGALAVAFLASPQFGGTGIIDYIARPGQGVVAIYDMFAQFWVQMKAVLVTLAWSAFVSVRLYKLVDLLVGLRPHEDEEDEGLDVVDHGERAYNH